MIEPLDIFAAPLDAINLIEASAGTGKTYAIAGLYLRLLVERGYSAGDILVVTYTRAATEELKERIHNRLLQARQVFQQQSAGDPFYRKMLACYPDRQRAIRRLNRAILAFDQAAIFTIHGFCQRVLNDSAFASGLPLAANLLADDAELLQAIVEDYWRRRFYDIPARWANYVVNEKLDPGGLRQRLRPHLNKPYLQLAELAPGETLDCLEPAFEKAFQEVRRIWLAERDTIVGLLLDHQGLNKKSYTSDKIQQWALRLEAWFEQEDRPDCKAPEAFEYFTATRLKKALNKGHSEPVHPFFVAGDGLKTVADRLQGCLDGYLLRLQQELLLYCNHELPRRKRQLQVQSYDDLLLNLHNALDDQGQGERLAGIIRERFKAALIDEFQDTDPTQYAIFQTIYGGSGQPVFLVGDPKQAIYSFRGADIFAYLRARQDAAQAHTLAVNWRSDPGLIAAVNALFGGQSLPFLLEQIPFQAVTPAGKTASRLVADDGDDAPFRWWFVTGPKEDGADTSKRRQSRDRRQDKQVIRPRIAMATAGRIARLLTLAQRGQAYLTEGERRRPLTGGDIAVLVRDRHQSQEIRAALLEAGVPSVQHSRDSVFVTDEVVELERVLQAIAVPRQEERVRAALLTDLFGIAGDELYRLMQREQEWENVLFEFNDYHERWRDQGFIQMFRALLSRRDGYRRLLGFRDGERRLTNMLHLAELLQAASLQQRLGMTGLLKWLAEQRQADIVEDDARQLRLESDAELVKIVTVHKSKGLEYPIVFCPFLWDGKLTMESAKTRIFSFHDPEDEFRAVLDMGSERQEERRPHAVREELAENLRLTYVALTRAKHRCYTVWGALKDNEKSALAWLLYRPSVKDPHDDAITANRNYVKQLNDQGLLQPLQALVEKSAGTIHIAPLPLEKEAAYHPDSGQTPLLAARQFTGQIRAGRRFASFTALQERHELESPDYDAVLESPLLDSAERSIFTFPQGARAGRCLHAIFEAIDFTWSEQAIAVTVAEQLRKYGFEEDWSDVIALMVEQALRTPLDAAGQLKLAKISRRLTELEFMYPFEQLDMQPLRRLLQEFGVAMNAAPDAQDFRLRRGFMRGFIDLVFEHENRFYLVDYKSNWLGPTLDDYRPDKLAAAMTAGGYHLQYLIYTVALHRYLRWRLPGYDYQRCFGGVRYLFLRGMRPERGMDSGVFAERPQWELVETLDGYLNGKWN